MWARAERSMAEVLARYPGRYVGAALQGTVRLENGALQFAGDGGGWVPLVPLSETEFVVGGRTRMRFVLDASGAVTALAVRISGRQVLVPRVPPATPLEDAPRKALFVILDGIPADGVERVETPAIDAIAAAGGYARASVGGELGGRTQTPTISAPG